MSRSPGLPARSWSGESVTSTVLNHCEMSRDAAMPSQAAGTQSAGDVREVRSRSSRNRPRIPAAQTTAASPEGIQDRSRAGLPRDRKSTRLNSSHTVISYAVFCLKKKKKKQKKKKNQRKTARKSGIRNT